MSFKHVQKYSVVLACFFWHIMIDGFFEATFCVYLEMIKWALTCKFNKLAYY
jgi:hypothetical protein